MWFNLAETEKTACLASFPSRLLVVVLGMTARKVSYAFSQGVSARSCPYEQRLEITRFSGFPISLPILIGNKKAS